ncbi:hypothetical protein PCIT_a4353 [Pseudoalteromonas citrea]|uniref:Uncharacterized protein n=2 Tax=Pseudoalteromonas citrea TaxID=43655 RepID=A0AAD4AFT6_9GAMM|nr:hypothetical protein [Pseudoalteromonas citrea]KAF7767469.1 hypothetical protein PCIT_a4353 [Pseudoalteromonas citrea]
MHQLFISALLPIMIAGCAPSASLSTQDATQAPVKVDTQAPVKVDTQAPVKVDIQAKYHNPVDVIPQAPKNTLSAARNKLKDMTKDKGCDTSMQCQVIAVGSRACGGPSSYVTFSTRSADVQTVKKLADSITVLESQYNAKNRMVSICQHLTQPSTQCVENKCVKIQGNAQATY